MKHIINILSVLVVLLIIPVSVSADGCMILPDYDTYVFSPSQKAVITWDGTTEILLLSTKIAMDKPENLAWVVPIKSSTQPEISEGSEKIFYEISTLLIPIQVHGKSPFGFDAIGGVINQGVEILEEKEVDIYDITVLRATDANVLVNWLNDNGYTTPTNAIPTLQYYVDQSDFYFIANKVDLTNKYPAFTITPEDEACLDYLIEMEYFHYYWGGYSNDESYDADRIRTIERMDECENADAQTVLVVYDLKLGISTPLKIEFQPPEIFYPMKMTSVNEGETNITVYVFASEYVKDRTGLMEIEKMTPISDYFKRILGKNNLTNQTSDFLTMLEFKGNTRDLIGDSIFETTTYDPTKDPNYVSPMDHMTYWLMLIATVVFVISFGFIPFVLIPFVFGYFFAWLTGKYGHVKVFFIIMLLILFGGLYMFSGSYFLFSYVVVFGAMPIIFSLYGFYVRHKKWNVKKTILVGIGLIVLSYAITFGILLSMF